MAKLGLALGSGAARGYAHIAIIQRLLREGLSFDMVSGTSAGSVIAAYFALHGEVDSLLKVIMNVKKRDYLKLVDINNPKFSLLKGTGIREFMKENLFGDLTFRDVQIPLVICATDIENHKPHYFRSGKLIDAVMASISIPGVFPPYKAGTRHYIDGAVFDPVPIDVHFQKAINKVIAVNINNFTYHPGDKDIGAIHVLTNTYFMLLEKISPKVSTKKAFILNPVFNPGYHDGLRLYKWNDYYNSGLKEIRKKLPEIRKWLRSK